MELARGQFSAFPGAQRAGRSDWLWACRSRRKREPVSRDEGANPRAVSTRVPAGITVVGIMASANHRFLMVGLDQDRDLPEGSRKPKRCRRRGIQTR